MQGDAAVAGALLEAGADPAAEGLVWDTTPELEADRKKWIYFPLLVAAREGHTAIVAALLAATGKDGVAVDLNLASKDGDTALILAAEKGHVEVVAASTIGLPCQT